MAIINLTPHTINLVDQTGQQIMEIPSVGLARVDVLRNKSINLFFENKGVTVEVPVNKSTFGEVTGLPESNKDDLFIVSMIVANALPDRVDLICPDETVRNDKGQIIGCKSFCRP